MSDLKEFAYAIQVGIVFNTQPRLGTDPGSIWVTRRREQDRFKKYFLTQGLHVLLDGPTGTGKTSLALTSLANLEIPYAKVVVTDGMTWQQLCVSASNLPPKPSRVDERHIVAGLDRGLPTVLYRATASPVSDPSARSREISEWASHVTEQEITAIMQRENLALMIDDSESASPDLVSRIANLAKLLTTERTASSNAKLVVVGTGDICRRLYLAKPALDKRVGEVSLGTFPDRSESWDFLRRGFERLDKLHPGNSSIPAQKAAFPKAIEALYDAADGLPKALNDLGREIAFDAEHRNITAATISKVAADKSLQNWRQFKRECRDLFGRMQANPITRLIVAYFYERGVGRIHDTEDIHGALDNDVGEAQIDQALHDLAEMGFITRTGISNQVVFVQSPSLAHTLGVVLKGPDAYPGAREMFIKNDGQLWLLPGPER